jgi:multidrug resistance efflux pump
MNEMLSLSEDRNVSAVGLTQRPIAVSTAVFLLLLLVVALLSFSSLFRPTVRSVGRLEPKRVFEIRAPFSGRVVGVGARSGNRVAKGELLVKIDATVQREAVQRLRIELAGLEARILQLTARGALGPAQVSHQLILSELQRVRSMATLREVLTAQGRSMNADSVAEHMEFGSNIALDVAVADVRIAQSSARVAKVEVEGLRMLANELEIMHTEKNLLMHQLDEMVESLKSSDVLSPSDGVVLNNVDTIMGQRVLEGDKLFEIGDTTSWIVKTSLTIGDVNRIRIGDTALLRISDSRVMPSTELRGVVSSIGEEPLRVQYGPFFPGDVATQGSVYEVKIQVVCPDMGGARPRHYRRGTPVEISTVTSRLSVRQVLLRWISNPSDLP